MSLHILLDDIPSTNFPFCISERPVIPGTKRRIKKEELAFKDGSITTTLGFLDRSFSIEFNILEERNIKQDIRYFKAYFFDKKTVRFSDDDVYYRINFVEFGDFDNSIEQLGTGSILFDIEPFDYALTSTYHINEPQTINNIGTYQAKPRLKIFINGNATLHFNNQSVQLSGITDYIVLDSELSLAYREKNEQLESKMIGKFPYFDTGPIDISWTGNVKKIEVEARWRFL